MWRVRGTQLWGDVRWQAGWRVQRRVGGQSFRLVDPRGDVHGHGRLLECEKLLAMRAPVRPPSTHTVVLLHGLGRTRDAFTRLERAIAARDWTPIAIDYPSTRGKIQDHIAQVGELLDHLSGDEPISLVTHSLGGLVARGLSAERERRWHGRLHAIAMLAPPNQGALLAQRLDSPVLRATLGPAFLEIAQGVPPSLPIPTQAFAIFAGALSPTATPWLPGTSDGVVQVEETHLDGATVTHSVRAVHTLIMDHREVVQASLDFLAQGLKPKA